MLAAIIASLLIVTSYNAPALTKSITWSLGNANTSAAASGSSKYLVRASGSPTTPNSIVQFVPGFAALNSSIMPVSISWSS